MKYSAIAGGLFLIFTVLLSGACIGDGFAVGRDIGAPLNRAQVAAQAEDVDLYMEQVQEGMERHDLTHGHWGLEPLLGFNKNVDNDFAVAYQSVLNIRERLADIKEFDKTSTEYQVALDDIRGTIRELSIGQQAHNAWQEHWWISLFWLITTGLFCHAAWLWFKQL